MDGKVILETGLYESLCGCRVKQEFQQGQRPPPCPICEREVVWVLRAAPKPESRRPKSA